MSDVPTDYSERTIAFLDILGFEAAIDRTRTDRSSFFTIGSALAEIVSHCSRIELRETHSRHPQELRAVWFSDTIVITGRPHDHGLRQVLHVALDMYGRLLHDKGLVLRGAVTRGRIYESGGILFGPGLVDAYRLEKKARYPRIVVGKDLVESLNGPEGEFNRLWALTTGAPATLCFHILMDADGLWYVDPLRAAAAHITVPPGDSGDPSVEWVRCFRERAEAGIAAHASDPHTQEKYQWMLARVDAPEGGW